MTDLQAHVTATETAFHVEGYEKIDYELVYAGRAFDVDNPTLADTYGPLGRCLMVVDEAVHELYGDEIAAYFAHHDIALTRLRGDDRRDRQVADARSSGSSTRSPTSACCAPSRCSSSAAG